MCVEGSYTSTSPRLIASVKMVVMEPVCFHLSRFYTTKIMELFKIKPKMDVFFDIIITFAPFY
jgi:hypothetical protein